MDKIRLSLSSSLRDFARLYDWRDGFHAGSERISFPGEQSLMLTLTSDRKYNVSAEGDVTIEEHKEVRDESIRIFTVTWSEPESRVAIGSGRVKIVHPDFPGEPYLLDLRMGEFKHNIPSPKDQAGRGAERLDSRDGVGVVWMMAQEMHHALFGHVLH